MNEYKLINELGLEVFKKGYHPESAKSDFESRMDFVSAKDLEALLEKGGKLYCEIAFGLYNFSAIKGPLHTHQFLIAGVSPIKKPKLASVSKADVLKFIKENSHWMNTEAEALVKRIEEAGIG